MKLFTKNDLNQRTKWLLKDCENMIEKLNKVGLAIVDIKEATELLNLQKRTEDDLK